jgi:hypothetical protein
MRIPQLIIISLLATLALMVQSAYADKGGNGHGKGKFKGGDGHYERHGGGRSDRVPVVIGSNDRVVISNYIVNDYRLGCPPGLAKKNNGCLPPGHAKARYIIGQPLPGTVVWQPVPQPLLMQLQPVPVGYQYVMVDRDVLLMSQASHHVIDAITLMSAVGN